MDEEMGNCKEPVFPEYTWTDSEPGRRLREFLPDKFFDAHVHAGHNFGFADYVQTMCRELPIIRDIRAMLIPMPERDITQERRDSLNKSVTDQLNRYPGNIGESFVLPGDSCEKILAMTDHPSIRGLKCYFYSAGKANPAIDEYLPEAAWEAANRKELAITLHLARASSLADPEDLEYIQRMCRKYPYAKLILAHCGRAFAAWTCQESVKQLRGIDNLYYDLSAICESVPMYYCLKFAGSDHVLWGSDHPISNFQGKAISVGGGFAWVKGDAIEGCGTTAPAMTVLQENLLAVYTAADMLELSAGEVECIFYGNMCELFCVR